MTARSRGFTLIEILIALALIAILAGIAMPSYRSSIEKARRTDAIQALQDLYMAQEQFRTVCSSYATSLDGAVTCDPGNSTYRVEVSATSTDGHYAIAILPGATGTGFTATADPAGTDQASDSCGIFAINQDGPITGNPSYADARCWKI